MAKEEKKKEKKEKKKGSVLKAKVFLIATILMGVIFLPTSMLLFVGMMPTMSAYMFRMRRGGTRASTIAAMNSAGCAPFVFKLWAGGNDFETSVDLITQPQTITIMYVAAAFGYMIDFVVKHLVASYLYQRGIKRMKDIKKRQAVLIEQWGRDVAGDYVKQNKEKSAKEDDD